MSSELRVLKASEVVRALAKAGYRVLPGRGKGSHIALSDGSHLLIVPNHGDVKRGTLRSLIRTSGMSVEQFRELL